MLILIVKIIGIMYAKKDKNALTSMKDRAVSVSTSWDAGSRSQPFSTVLKKWIIFLYCATVFRSSPCGTE